MVGAKPPARTQGRGVAASVGEGRTDNSAFAKSFSASGDIAAPAERTCLAQGSKVRWSPFAGQLGGLDKLGPGFRQAANLVTALAPYTSSGVLPPRPECGRLALYNSTAERPRDHGTEAVVSVASLER